VRNIHGLRLRTRPRGANPPRYHRHFFDVLPSILISIVLALAAGFFAYMMGRYPTLMPFPPIVSMLLVVVLISLSAIIFLVGTYVFRHNVLIFTNLHLIQVEQLAIFQRRVSQLSFLRVEDVTGRRVGFLQTVFNFGDVEVQSAGEQEKFIFHNAPNPELLADEALAIHEECVRLGGPGQPGD